MAMQGNLQDMAVADLIQHNCQDRKTAQLLIEHNGQQAALFFQDGAVLHATLGKLQGEEVVYQILNWQDGHFTLEETESNTAATITISRSWSGLLLEGARRLDEENHISNGNSIPLDQEEKTMAKKKSEILADTLAELLQESSDIDGAAIVGTDGLVYSANVPQRALDENMVGASSAAILGLSKRSADQLKRGGFKQTLIQGDDGNIIVVGLNDETLFVGLTSTNVNLGMAFAETRMMTEKLRDII
jgi:predicted regulator of Ras-like GTPase activity (Roadblock/LC7/MglB family)